MKVVHISFSDKIGGAAIAAYRHHEAMLQHGICSKMIVLKKRRNDKNVIRLRIFHNSIYKIINKLFNYVYKPKTLWSLWFGENPSNMPEIVNADAIIIHWSNFNTLSIKSIFNILKSGKPTYLFLHDMWFITGGCHHSFSCDKYKTSCKHCPQLRNLPESIIDLAAIEFNHKKKLIDFPNLRILTPSQWLLNCVRESELFRNSQSQVVRNYINTGFYKREEIDKTIYGLNKSKITILFGADSINSPYKGWDYLLKIFNNLNSDKFEVAIFGKANPESLKHLRLSYVLLGQIHNENELVRIYNACDILSISSKADNYPNVILEGMSCGLAVIAFSIGGIPEMIIEGITGFLIPPYDCALYERKLNYFANMSVAAREEMSNNASEQIKKYNSYSTANWPF